LTIGTREPQVLLKAGALQRAILNSANFSSIATDAKGVIQIFNIGAERMLGYTSAEVVNTITPADITDPQELIVRAQALSVEFSTPIAPGFEALVFKASRGVEDIYNLTYIRKDGSRFPAIVSVTALRDAQDAVIGHLLIGTDNTEREQAEAQLYLQGAALNAAANAIAITDRSGLIEWVNPAFSELTGYTSAEAVGKNPRDLVKSDQHDPAFYRNLWDTILSGHVWRGEMINRRKDHSLYTEEQTITPVRDLDGEISHFIAIKQDITEHKRVEEEFRQSVEALRASEGRTRFALENANVGIWDMDYTTGVLRWSETIEAHYGLRPGTFGGTFEAFVERIHADDRAPVLETVGKAMKAGTDFSIQNRSIWPDGTVRWLSGAGRILLGEHGEPVRGVGISLDVTERRTLQAQFQQAQKMEAVGRLAGGVAHDFNNLLTAILGYCELLLDDIGPGDPRGADIIEIQAAGTRAAGLTRQLLAFSRKQIIEPTRLDLNAIVADIRGMLERLIGEDVKIVVALVPDLAPVMADHGEVEQVIMNLAVNARDAMPKGGTLRIETANVELDELHVTTHLDVKPGPYVVLTVTDAGTGMTPAVRARLFEPFFTTKEPGKGTGLGLATVYGIVTRSGGSIRVYTELGKGTAFKVYFPRADAVPVTVETVAPVARPRAGSQTVLVVEDEEGLRELARRLLQRLGYTVLIAADAAEARRIFDEQSAIDLLLTDVVMPGASGPELTRQLIEQRPALKVIYMSGYTEDAIVQHGVLKPGIAFLNKPFTSQTLGQKIREVLER
jgi:PAS domain S-box-containing protein